MNQKQDDSKRRILDAAKACFANSGYDQTSIRKICETADANLALVAYYFGSKEKLYYTVIEQLHIETNKLFDDKAPEQNPREALHHFIDTFTRMRTINKQFHMLLRHELSSQNPRGEHIRRIISPYFDHLKKIVIAGKEQGVFVYESLELTLTFIASILVYPAYDSYLVVSPPAPDASAKAEAEQTAAFIFAGLHCKAM
jgi:AcrR family transcriptional regulator